MYELRVYGAYTIARTPYDKRPEVRDPHGGVKGQAGGIDSARKRRAVVLDHLRCQGEYDGLFAHLHVAPACRVCFGRAHRTALKSPSRCHCLRAGPLEADGVFREGERRQGADPWDPAADHAIRSDSRGAVPTADRRVICLHGCGL